MAFEYEALVGYLYVVGGRTISSPPPGAHVEVAPRKVARGRETDTFFTLVFPSGDTAAPSIFYENMAQLVTERYFNSSGSVTNGLRAMMNHVNENLYDHNQRDSKHYEANLICVVLRGTDLYVARVGSGVALFRHEGEVNQFPVDFSNDEQLFGPPLGVQMSPDVKMTKYEVSNGSRLIIADPALADIPFTNLVPAIAGNDISEMLVSLKGVSSSQMMLMAIEFVPPEAPSPLPLRVGSNSSEILSKPITETKPPADPTAEEEKPAEAEEASAPAGPRRSEGRDTVVANAVGTAAVGVASLFDGVNKGLDKVVPLPKEDRKGFLATPAAAGLAILIPVLVVIGVVILWISGTGQSEFELCAREASESATTARSIASSDRQGTLDMWNAVIQVINECNQIQSGDPALASIEREGRNIIDALMQIARRQTIAIDALPSAQLSRGVLQGDDMYLLDDANDLVYRLTLSADGFSVSPGTRTPIGQMNRGRPIAQFTIGDIFDIAWADDGSGLSQGSVITAIDTNGLLIDCPPRFLQNCNAQQLYTDVWTDPIAIAFWGGRLYVLDPGANQIWRYDPSGGAFPNAPIEYFVGENRPNIRGAVDFSIDTSGSIYIMMDVGVLTRFTSGRQDDFAFSGLPTGQNLIFADSFLMNNQRPIQGMFFPNREERTIYETTMNGTFVNSYRANDDRLFAELNDVLVEPNRQIVYALSGNTVLAFSWSG